MIIFLLFLPLQKDIHTQKPVDLNIIPEAIKLLEENIGGKLPDIELGSAFLDKTKNLGNTAGTEKWDSIKLKQSCTAKDTISRVRSQLYGM